MPDVSHEDFYLLHVALWHEIIKCQRGSFKIHVWVFEKENSLFQFLVLLNQVFLLGKKLEPLLLVLIALCLEEDLSNASKDSELFQIVKGLLDCYLLQLDSVLDLSGLQANDNEIAIPVSYSYPSPVAQRANHLLPHEHLSFHYSNLFLL